MIPKEELNVFGLNPAGLTDRIKYTPTTFDHYWIKINL